MEFVLYPVLIVGGLGAIYGLILAFASLKFKVEIDLELALLLTTS